MKYIYRFIDDIPMYKLTLYALIGILLTAVVLSAIGELSFSLSAIGTTLAIIAVVSYGINKLFALVFGARTNIESSLITGLIIFFIIFPQDSVEGWLYAAITAAIAQASKYILAVRGRHIFNPAAVAVVISGLIGLSSAVWWIGTPLLVPAIIVFGGLVVIKVRELSVVATYLFTAAIITIIVGLFSQQDIGTALWTTFIAGPLLFVGTIMLTEPLTSSGEKWKKLLIAGLIGLLVGSGIAWIAKPEIALLIGNVIAFAFSQRRLVKLKFIEIQQLAPGIIEAIFEPLRPVRFRAGQYIEVTLPHRSADFRGVRRVFSIASSPGSRQLRLGMNVPSPSSSFKHSLSGIKPGDIIHATRVGGDFVLPRSTRQPIVLIAGGIGITPFRSMIEDLLDRQERRAVTVFYGVKDSSAMVYGDSLLRTRDQLGAQIIPVIARPGADWNGEQGVITADLIKKYVTSSDAIYYISGSNMMVESVRRDLIKHSVKRSQIHTDYFTGY